MIAATEFHLTTGHIVRFVFGLLMILFLLGFAIWGYVQILKKSDDPWLLIFKSVLTFVCAGIWLGIAVPMALKGGMEAFGGVAITLIEGLIMAITWRRNIAGLIADPIGSLYDGGNTPYERKPVYSRAMAARKLADFQGALALIRAELEVFPTDIEGQLLMAEILADNLHDLDGAAMCVERICNQPEHTPRNIAFALNMLADWHLKLNQGREVARETLQRIIDKFPESEMAVLAAQRIASLASPEHLIGGHERKKFTVVEGVQNLGLLDPKFHPTPASPDAANQAAELVAHLQAHPLDGDAREQLAIIYADHYGRMDLATDQLNQLITHPNQPQKRVVHWINKLADLQIRHGANYETVRATLQRVVELYPGSPAAEVTSNRIAILKLELKGREKVTDVKMGTYEQDIGLRVKS